MAIAMVTASQLASVNSISSSMQRFAAVSGGGIKTNKLEWRTVGLPTIECAKHAQKKATAHHNKSRPKKHRPSDKNRKPPVYPAIGKPPPIWGLDLGESSVQTTEAKVEVAVA